MVSNKLLPGYQLSQGSGLDRAKLVKFMHQTYQEIEVDGEFGHLAQTVEQYLSKQTPLWWVEWYPEDSQKNLQSQESLSIHPSNQHPQPLTVGCLWLGNAIDQVSGDRHAHIFLLYVAPEHRRRGIGKALVHQAETWARERGDRKIGLQVFLSNQPALNLYQKLGYKTQALSMLKPL